MILRENDKLKYVLQAAFFGIAIGAIFFSEPLAMTVLIGVGLAASGVYLAAQTELPRNAELDQAPNEKP